MLVMFNLSSIRRCKHIRIIGNQSAVKFNAPTFNRLKAYGFP